MNYPKIVAIVYFSILFVSSVAALFLFGKDKSAAEAAKDRVKEKTLLSVAALGGAVGAFLGRLVFRHKTNKIYFSVVIYFSLLLQIAVAALLLVRAL